MRKENNLSLRYLSKYFIISVLIIVSAGFIFTIYSSSINVFIQRATDNLGLSTIVPNTLDSALAADHNNGGGTISSLTSPYSALTGGDEYDTQTECTWYLSTTTSKTKDIPITIAKNVVDGINN
ncbi:MAG: hypothetical protein LBU04_06675, partial [Christensenellaceae bacterium]|nr:hypothetical protein [Christensenellaceae bacterium]